MVQHDAFALDAITDDCRAAGLQIERRNTGWQIAGMVAYHGPERRLNNWRIAGRAPGNHILIDVTGMTPAQALNKAREQLAERRRQYNAEFHQQLFVANELFVKELFAGDA